MWMCHSILKEATHPIYGTHFQQLKIGSCDWSMLTVNCHIPTLNSWKCHFIVCGIIDMYNNSLFIIIKTRRIGSFAVKFREIQSSKENTTHNNKSQRLDDNSDRTKQTTGQQNRTQLLSALDCLDRNVKCT